MFLKEDKIMASLNKEDYNIVLKEINEVRKCLLMSIYIALTKHKDQFHIEYPIIVYELHNSICIREFIVHDSGYIEFYTNNNELFELNMLSTEFLLSICEGFKRVSDE